MSELQLHVTVEGGDSVVAAEGELDLDTAPALTEWLCGALAGGARRIVVDLRDVSFIDSSGLMALHGAHMAAAESGAALVLRGVSPHILNLLSASGLDTVLTLEN